MKRRTILITGINGFLGSHLAKTLSKSYDIIGLEVDTNNLFRIEGCHFKIYPSNDVKLDLIFTENDILAVIHTATVYRKSNEPVDLLLRTNILFPANLITLADKYRVPFFINTDTFFNQEGSEYSYMMDYTLSKKHALDWLRLLKGKCYLINMKVFHMYGPNDTPSKFVPWVISAIKSGKKYLDLTPGEQKRDFIYIDDVVAAYEAVLKQSKNFSGAVSEFEVGTGYSVTIKEFVNSIKEITKSTTELKFGALPYRGNEMMDAKANNKQLIELGWKPMNTAVQGLRKILSTD